MNYQEPSTSPSKKGLSRKAKFRKLQNMFLASLALNIILLLVILIMAYALMSKGKKSGVDENNLNSQQSISDEQNMNGTDEDALLQQTESSTLNTNETDGNNFIIYYIDP